MGRGENVSTIVSQAVLLVSKPNTQPVWPRILAGLWLRAPTVRICPSPPASPRFSRSVLKNENSAHVRALFPSRALETATFPPDRRNQARLSLSRVGTVPYMPNRIIGDRSSRRRLENGRQIDTFESQLSVWRVFTHIRHESIIIKSLQKVETVYDSFDNVKGDWADKGS